MFPCVLFCSLSLYSALTFGPFGNIRNKQRSVLVQYGTQHFIDKLRDDSVFYLTTVYLHLYLGLYFAELIYRLELIVEIVLGCVILSDSKAQEKH